MKYTIGSSALSYIFHNQHKTLKTLYIDSSSRGSKKQNPSSINLVPELITLAISIKTDYDSHLLIKHAITPVNQWIFSTYYNA